jgi:aryl-alcohol dehydrogenase-like predicted oxidoreductase
VYRKGQQRLKISVITVVVAAALKASSIMIIVSLLTCKHTGAVSCVTVKQTCTVTNGTCADYAELQRAAITITIQQIASNQVQLNLIDRRALTNMTALCQEHNIELLAHGTLLGGLLTDYWLRRRDPGLDALATAAEKKYYPEVLAWGGGRLTHWKQHQALLAHCREIADKYSVSVSSVTAAACMQ